jgi:hypothetical protein
MTTENTQTEIFGQSISAGRHGVHVLDSVLIPRRRHFRLIVNRATDPVSAANHGFRLHPTYSMEKSAQQKSSRCTQFQTPTDADENSMNAVVKRSARSLPVYLSPKHRGDLIRTWRMEQWRNLHNRSPAVVGYSVPNIDWGWREHRPPTWVRNIWGWRELSEWSSQEICTKTQIIVQYWKSDCIW